MYFNSVFVFFMLF